MIRASNHRLKLNDIEERTPSFKRYELLCH